MGIATSIFATSFPNSYLSKSETILKGKSNHVKHLSAIIIIVIISMSKMLTDQHHFHHRIVAPLPIFYFSIVFPDESFWILYDDGVDDVVNLRMGNVREA